MYVPFLVLMILHSKVFWYFFIIPGFIFIIEKIKATRMVSLAEHGQMFVVEVDLMVSKVNYFINITYNDCFNKLFCALYLILSA